MPVVEGQKKRITILTGGIDADYHVEGHSYSIGAERRSPESMRVTGTPPDAFMPCDICKWSVETTTAKKHMMARGSDSSKIKV